MLQRLTRRRKHGSTGIGRHGGFEPTCVSGLALSWIVVGGCVSWARSPCSRATDERTNSLDLGKGRATLFVRSKLVGR
jgi:hypothetical protein